MGALMDLIAGDTREVLLAIAVEDWVGLQDRRRFDAHVSLGPGLDPAWLDCFSQAARNVTGSPEPRNFIEARQELEGPADVGDRTVERIERGWIRAVARLGERDLDHLTGRWIDLIEEEYGHVQSEEKPWIRELAGELVKFARAAEDSPDVLFAWSI